MRRATLQPSLGGSCADQLHDDLVADQRLAAPALSDEGEQPRIASRSVPLARARGQMRHGDRHSDLIGQLLPILPLPQADPDAIAATAIGGDQQPLCPRIAELAEFVPPASDAFDGEGGGVVIEADADPSFIGGDIVDAVGHCPARVPGS